MHFTEKLSRRERQILEAVYRRGAASVGDVLAELPDPPSYSAIRAFLGILEEKGYLIHTQEGAKYIYHPTAPRPSVAQEALSRLVETFFGGRPEQVVAALLTDEERKISDEDLERLSALIAEARQRGDE
jgi:BlaI family transcriptional regulator, penicillinase repressor